MNQIITVDFETYYSNEYSLTKLTTEEYVRSPQFETIGVAIKTNDEPTVWYPKPQVEEALDAIDWEGAFVIAQNTAFDGAIMRWIYNINPRAWVDIMGMSRALYPHEKSHSLKAQAERAGIGEKGDEVLNALGKRYADFTPEQLDRYGEYCRNDVELTYKLFTIYANQGFPGQEVKLLDQTLRLFIDPVLELDEALLRAHLADVKDRKETLLDTIRNKMLEGAKPEFVHMIFSEGEEGLKKLLMSNEKFAEALRVMGVDPPMKLSATTGKMAYAFAKTDEAMKALAEHPNEEVQALVAARLGHKTTLEETRTERFIGMAGRGKFPVPLRYYGAHSGRWSGQDKVNLQNSPARGIYANKLKRAIKPPPGYVIIDCDSSQIEARTLAWMAGQTDLVQAFEDKQDVYKIMASIIYGVPIDQVTKEQRQVGKVVILGAGYGVGHVKLRAFLKNQAGVVVSEDEARAIIQTYRTTYSRIPELWRRADEALRALYYKQSYTIDIPGLCRTDDIGITLPSGLHIQYPDLMPVLKISVVGGAEKQGWQYTSKGLPTNVYGGLVTENICQAVARCVIGEQMLRIAKRYRVVLTVHDAVACIAPVEEAAEAQRYVEECMSWRPSWAPDLPLACESGMGASYGEC
jgi:DNA polymerase I-like protein with 3'-5' exonuclease and polymerase domains